MLKGVIAGIMAFIAPLLGCIGMSILVVVIIFGVAGNILGFLFGGAPPAGQPNAFATPAGPPINATPTPRPADCYIVPTAVAITATPQPTFTPFPTFTPDLSATLGGTLTPTYTPWPTSTAVVQYLPTATPCPTASVGFNTGVYNPIAAPSIQLATFKTFLVQDCGNSPATAEADAIYAAISQGGGDPAVALSFFIHESTCGRFGVAASTKSWGNIRCSAGYSCQFGFRSYATWTDGAKDWISLMLNEYHIARHLDTPEQIIPVYAPQSDNNNEKAYIDGIKAVVDKLRSREGGDDNTPHGSPYQAIKYVVTQDYGCTDFVEFSDPGCASSTGGRKPYFHRGVDIVSMGNKTVHATIKGRVTIAGFASDGFGIRVVVENGQWQVFYPHLSQTLVQAGDTIVWGQPIGIEGSTGYSTGSHLHYEIHQNGRFIDSTPYLIRP